MSRVLYFQKYCKYEAYGYISSLTMIRKEKNMNFNMFVLLLLFHIETVHRYYILKIYNEVTNKSCNYILYTLSKKIFDNYAAFFYYGIFLITFLYVQIMYFLFIINCSIKQMSFNCSII